MPTLTADQYALLVEAVNDYVLSGAPENQFHESQVVKVGKVAVAVGFSPNLGSWVQLAKDHPVTALLQLIAYLGLDSLLVAAPSGLAWTHRTGSNKYTISWTNHDTYDFLEVWTSRNGSPFSLDTSSANPFSGSATSYIVLDVSSSQLVCAKVRGSKGGIYSNFSNTDLTAPCHQFPGA